MRKTQRSMGEITPGAESIEGQKVVKIFGSQDYSAASAGSGAIPPTAHEGGSWQSSANAVAVLQPSRWVSSSTRSRSRCADRHDGRQLRVGQGQALLDSRRSSV